MTDSHSVCVSVCVCDIEGLLTSAACDVTSLAGSTVSLDCPSPTVSYSGYFAWRFYSSQQGQVIYSQPPFTLNDDDFPATRYCQVGDFGLEISSVGWPDGGVYACHFLTGQELIKHSVVVVIGQFMIIIITVIITTS